MRGRLVAIAAAGCVLAALLPASAGAYVVGGKPWPATTITYYVAAKAYAGPVNRAARIWNRADVGVEFSRASRSQADVVVAYGGPRCAGYSPVGFGGWDESTVSRLGAGCSKAFITLTAVHELGHVLGLDHEYRKCARMNWTFSKTGTPVRCRQGHSLSYWLEHPLEPDDIRGARALYQS
ncbi:MAG TPA: matrixin family metalloprotease [Thermoleophilaceae bacterium]|nr:matrixin family metalloprotease [Thermoleophilaceae bacterium]